MSAKAGEECRYSNDFRCEHCGGVIHVDMGLTIPSCPECGHGTFSLLKRPPHK